MGYTALYMSNQPTVVFKTDLPICDLLVILCYYFITGPAASVIIIIIIIIIFVY